MTLREYGKWCEIRLGCFPTNMKREERRMADDSQASGSAVTVTREGVVALVRLNEPRSLNALSAAMKAGLAAAVEELIADDGVRAIVLTGEGRAFCAGGDIRTMTQNETVAVRRRMQASHQWVQRLLDCEKLILTAVNGVAAGGGFSIALFGDIVCAADDARFRAGFPGIGAVPDLAIAYLLPRAVGAIRAKDILLANEDISAAEGHRLGFVSRLFPAESLVERTLELATRLAEGPSVSFGLAKRLVARAHELPLEVFLEAEAFAQMTAFGSADFEEGVSAFMAKRKPVFAGA
ncbi:enoyl-CoA hydratase/isomerase family protein [Xanthobacter sp.]|uniref:enoyl-CoA hydratase/isomerase family protein n=1 Tax=Xanthobacter sp. TaxID=35809 RepID=UPI0025F9E3DD|nr:enoyl-CoA hydratase/isomerase family protein [Xanthobacter sp.]